MPLRMSVDALLTATDSDFLVFTQSGPEVTIPWRNANDENAATLVIRNIAHKWSR
jgi:hypothetical protein